MKANELMIGDLVDVHRCECVADDGHYVEWNEYGKVVSITECYITIKYIGREGTDYDLDFEPIDSFEHWQDVRERAAIAAMQGVMNFFGSIDYNRDTIAKLAVEQADALIEELKKK